MFDKLVKRLRYCSEEQNGCGMCALSSDCVLRVGLLTEAADAIEEMSKRITRAVELYNRGVEKSAMWEALEGISPEPQKEET